LADISKSENVILHSWGSRIFIWICRWYLEQIIYKDLTIRRKTVGKVFLHEISFEGISQAFNNEFIAKLICSCIRICYISVNLYIVLFEEGFRGQRKILGNWVKKLISSDAQSDFLFFSICCTNLTRNFASNNTTASNQNRWWILYFFVDLF
jgi:hypothetical protein